MVAQYDGEIAYGDREFGRFVRALIGRRLRDRADAIAGAPAPVPSSPQGPLRNRDPLVAPPRTSAATTASPSAHPALALTG